MKRVDPFTARLDISTSLQSLVDGAWFVSSISYIAGLLTVTAPMPVSITALVLVFATLAYMDRHAYRCEELLIDNMESWREVADG